MEKQLAYVYMQELGISYADALQIAREDIEHYGAAALADD